MSTTINQLVAARDAAIAAGDPHGTNLWASTAWRRIRGGAAAGIVAAQAERLHSIIEDLLALSRIEQDEVYAG